MRFIPTKSGGRILQGSTPYGDFLVEWGPDGVLIRESLTMRTPPAAPTASTRAGAQASDEDLRGCSPCEEAARAALAARSKQEGV
jgi:hypothetical protein